MIDIVRAIENTVQDNFDFRPTTRAMKGVVVLVLKFIKKEKDSNNKNNNGGCNKSILCYSRSNSPVRLLQVGYFSTDVVF